ncbi:3-oxoacyl-[acyl-carrier-protein] synthase III C-terminal domain-containing protein [Brevibacillus fulvus]|uniref:3-oxoacyl-[acyl-carrier-protein] synthase-3 n=1 Tax=Brevibacillus fulvus TaxID=1125967 RepID=A0A938XXR3_9BACL|nr:3-oxoacyl-[acyl-carrier-protein] synthase III C-terminal domain-containing protein [Brevibacillus fulvus]MBM7589640.1 3-oxoacyl-[acyl-carrier-protein] synthase-3 [Brevibacillus fulvus]
MRTPTDDFSIHDLSVYVPPRRVSVERLAAEIVQHGGVFSGEEIRRFKTDYRFSHVPVERERSLPEMLREACHPLVERLRRQSLPIDRILMVRTSELSWHDENMLREVLHTYGLQERPFHAIGQHNCASVHLALRMARNLFRTDPYTSGILLVSADKAIHPFFRRLPDSLLGDCASACYLIRGRKLHRTLLIENVVDPTFYDGISGKAEDWKWFQTTYFFALRQIIMTTLRKASLAFDDVRLLIGSNVNYRTWQVLAEMLRLRPDKFYTETIAEAGHLYCSDILYNLQAAVADGRLRKGDLYLTVSVGIGSYGCALHQF